jgi:TolB-like protein
VACLLLALATTRAAAQQPSATVAVLPFTAEQSFGLEPDAYRALQLGVADLLASELGRSPGVVVADRRRTAEAAGSGRLDAEAARRAGAAVGATYAVLGNVVDAFGTVRVNARVVDVSSGRYLTSATNADPALQGRDHLHQGVQAVAEALLRSLGLPPAPPRAPISTEAITSYGAGLEAERAGDRTAAAGHFAHARALAPGFTEATEAAARAR